MPNRHGSSDSYRYGYNGMEKDDEIKGDGNSYDYGFRHYDPRLGRFLSVDPKSSSYAFLSPYSYAANNPILLIDSFGLNPTDPPTYLTGHEPLTINVLEGFLLQEGLKKVTYGQVLASKFDKKVVTEYWEWNKAKGHVLEKAFLDAYSLKKNSKMNKYGSIPDAVTASNKVEAEVKFYGLTAKTSYDVERFEGGHIIEIAEVKAYASEVKFTNQIKAHILAAANAENDENETASDEEAAFLTIVTLSGVKISDKIIDYATKKNVNVVHIQASYNPNTGEIGFSKGQLLNDLYNILEFDSESTVKTTLTKDFINQKPQDPDVPTKN